MIYNVNIGGCNAITVKGVKVITYCSFKSDNFELHMYIIIYVHLPLE